MYLFWNGFVQMKSLCNVFQCDCSLTRLVLHQAIEKTLPFFYLCRICELVVSCARGNKDCKEAGQRHDTSKDRGTCSLQLNGLL